MYSPRAIGGNPAKSKSSDELVLERYVADSEKGLAQMYCDHIPFYAHMQNTESALTTAPEIVEIYLAATEKLQPSINLQEQRIKTLNALLNGEVPEKTSIDSLKAMLIQNERPTDSVDRILEGNKEKQLLAASVSGYRR